VHLEIRPKATSAQEAQLAAVALNQHPGPGHLVGRTGGRDHCCEHPCRVVSRRALYKKFEGAVEADVERLGRPMRRPGCGRTLYRTGPQIR
jgi:hypothetical protein